MAKEKKMKSLLVFLSVSAFAITLSTSASAAEFKIQMRNLDGSPIDVNDTNPDHRPAEVRLEAFVVDTNEPLSITDLSGSDESPTDNFVRSDTGTVRIQIDHAQLPIKNRGVRLVFSRGQKITADLRSVFVPAGNETVSLDVVVPVGKEECDTSCVSQCCHNKRRARHKHRCSCRYDW